MTTRRIILGLVWSVCVSAPNAFAAEYEADVRLDDAPPIETIYLDDQDTRDRPTDLTVLHPNFAHLLGIDQTSSFNADDITSLLATIPNKN